MRWAVFLCAMDPCDHKTRESDMHENHLLFRCFACWDLRMSLPYILKKLNLKSKYDKKTAKIQKKQKNMLQKQKKCG